MNSFVILTSPTCLWCDKAKRLLDELKFTYVELDITQHEGLRIMLSALGITTVPQVFNRHVRIGGYTELSQMYGRLVDEAKE